MTHSHHLGIGSLGITPLTPDMKALLTRKKPGQKKQEDKLPPSTPKKGAEKSGELFPQIAAKNELPEKGDETADFNSSFLHRKEPLFNYKKRVEFVPEEFNTPWEKKLLNTPAGVMVNSANLLTNSQMLEQVARLEAFLKLHKDNQEKYQEEVKTLRELADNAKTTGFWSSMQDLAGYLMSAGGLIDGAAQVSQGINKGNPLLVGAGVVSAIGGIGNLAAIYLRKHEYNAWLVNCLTLGSTLLTGGAKLATFGVDTSTTFKTVLEGAGSVGGMHAKYNDGKANAKRFELQAKTNDLKFAREKNKIKMEKKAKGTKSSEMKGAIEAASDQLARRNELLERITRTPAAA